MKSQILKFRGMSHSLQFSQLGTSISIYFIGSSLAIYPSDLRGKNYRNFTSSFTSCSPIIPVKHYSNADILKEIILNENKSKSGVYRFTNTINNKSYVGSSENLRKRFNHYYSGSTLLRAKTTSAISNALLKYGYSNFSLEILEYCDPIDTIKREQHYLDLLKPEYNILTTAGSSLGHKQLRRL